MHFLLFVYLQIGLLLIVSNLILDQENLNT